MQESIDRSPTQNSALSGKLCSFANTIRETAQQCRGDSLALLSMLRALEQLHTEIRDGLFQESLPNDRQNLYTLLRDIETSGGWPYISRMRLSELLHHLQTEPDEPPTVTTETLDVP